MFLLLVSLVYVRLKRTHIFGTKLSPVNFWCDISRLVSYYALFKGWLPLSQPPN